MYVHVIHCTMNIQYYVQEKDSDNTFLNDNTVEPHYYEPLGTTIIEMSIILADVSFSTEWLYYVYNIHAHNTTIILYSQH